MLKKPVEVYVFVDPLCADCWAMEPILKKLIIEYGRFFKIRPIISGKMSFLCAENKQKFAKEWNKTASRTGMSCDNDIWIDTPISSPWLTSLAVKAAELQGGKAGTRYLRKVREYLFADKQNITEEHVLLKCAEETHLDMEEFKQDLKSDAAKRALQCDLKLTKEMEVEYLPTIVFFNESEDEEGIKISGLYSYDVYVSVLHEILRKSPRPAVKPTLEEFLRHFKFVATKEVSTVFDWTLEKAEKEMKKLQLKRQVDKVPVKYGTFWRYKEEY
ncbi:DsbA family protein [Salirhabdus salicampi]|nr:DsbA family protein [Salirhabdus salicampi]